jgi:uncharacterized protein YjbI with pentapeptide repeats
MPDMRRLCQPTTIYTPTHRMRTQINDLSGNPICECKGGLVGARLIYLKLQQADLRGLVLEGASFIGSDLTGADLSGADIYWGWFMGANLTDAKLRGARLSGADFTEAWLVRADLSGANLGTDNVGGSTSLKGANLSDAILDDANLTGAIYDRLTRFPDGFSPVLAGMKLEKGKGDSP